MVDGWWDHTGGGGGGEEERGVGPRQDASFSAGVCGFACPCRGPSFAAVVGGPSWAGEAVADSDGGTKGHSCGDRTTSIRDGGGGGGGGDASCPSPPPCVASSFTSFSSGARVEASDEKVPGSPTIPHAGEGASDVAAVWDDEAGRTGS